MKNLKSSWVEWMSKVKVQSLPKKKVLKRDLYAEICYYYSRYSLKEAKELPARDVDLLIKTGRKMEGLKMYNQTLIVNSVNSAKGKAAKELLKHYKGMIDG